MNRTEPLDALGRTLDLIPDGVLAVDRNFRIAYTNPALDAMFGYARHTLLGSNLDTLLPEAARSRHAAHVNRYLAAPTERRMGSGRRLEGTSADGEHFPVEVALSPRLDLGPGYIIAVVRDLRPDLLRARSVPGTPDLADSHAALDSNPAPCAILDRSGHITAVNAAWSAFARANGANEGTVRCLGCDYLAVCPPDIRQTIADVLSGRRHDATIRYTCHSPFAARWFEARVVALEGGALVAHIDLTAPVLLEARHRLHDVLAVAIAQGTPPLDAASALLRETCRALDWELGLVWTVQDGLPRLRRVITMGGTKVSLDLHGRATTRPLAPTALNSPASPSSPSPVWMESPAAFRDGPLTDTLRRAGFQCGLSIPMFQAAEQVGILELYGLCRRPRDETLALLISSIQLVISIAERRRQVASLEEEASQTHARLHALFSSSRDALLTIAPPDWVVTSANPAALDFLDDVGPVPLVGSRFIEACRNLTATGASPPTSSFLATALAQGEYLFSWELRGPGGGEHTASVRLSRVNQPGAGPYLLVTLRDDTVHRRLRDRANESERLATIGALAAGVAHEINTPVQFISDNVHFLEESARELLTLEPAGGGGLEFDYLRDQVPLSFRRVREGIERVTIIVRALLSMARRGPARLEWVDIGECVRSAVTVATSELRCVAEVSVQVESVPPVLCARHEISQVVLNLLVNAGHAIRERHGEGRRGHIQVTAFANDDEVCLAITDDGIGIRPELRNRIFDPFFTTKAAGVGTGQGLAIAHRIIVEEHGGSIDVDSTPGGGTTFTLRLPVTGPTERPRVH